MRWVLLAALLQMAATCGQKGPLTLPDEEAGGATIHFWAAAWTPFPISAAAHARGGPCKQRGSAVA